MEKFLRKEKIKFLWSIIFKNSSYGLYFWCQWKDHISSIELSLHLCRKIRLNIAVYFWILYSIPLTYIWIHLTIPHQDNYLKKFENVKVIFLINRQPEILHPWWTETKPSEVSFCMYGMKICISENPKSFP